MKRMVDKKKFENIGLNEYIKNSNGNRIYYCLLSTYVSNDDGDKNGEINNYAYIPIKSHITESIFFNDRDELKAWLLNNVDSFTLTQITYDPDDNAYKNSVFTWSPSTEQVQIKINHDPTYDFDWDGADNYITFILTDCTTGATVSYEE